MSLETASKLLKEVNVEEFKNKSKEEIELFIKEKGYDCTIEELEKAAILSEELSEDELDKVSGGKGERANCTGDYYDSDCHWDVDASICSLLDRDGKLCFASGGADYYCTNVARCHDIPF